MAQFNQPPNRERAIPFTKRSAKATSANRLRQVVVRRPPWISIGSLSLWGLRSEIALGNTLLGWRCDMAYYNPLPTFGLAFVSVLTVAVLVWQSRNILLGCHAQNSGA